MRATMRTLRSTSAARNTANSATRGRDKTMKAKLLLGAIVGARSTSYTTRFGDPAPFPLRRGEFAGSGREGAEGRQRREESSRLRKETGYFCFHGTPPHSPSQFPCRFRSCRQLPTNCRGGASPTSGSQGLDARLGPQTL
jgi:hypothetical protein